MLIRLLLATRTGQRAALFASLLKGEDEVRVRALGPEDNLWEALRTEDPDLLVVDEDLLGERPEVTVAEIRNLPHGPEIVVFVEEADPARRAALLAAKVFAVLDREVERGDVVEALKGIIARRTGEVRQELSAELTEEVSSLSDFASSSPTMRDFLSFVRKVIDTDSTLLVQGDTGVGKEYLSRAIHAESPRSAGPFVPVNCSALSESLLESELFGHVEGAFTGAQRARRGYFEMAHQGTLFLDEVGELSPKTQVKLLRVLQDTKIQPVGGEEELAVDVRLIAATNRDLRTEMEAGRFRADLFYRMSVVSLRVPSLSERKEDIPGLVESHVENFRFTLKRPVEGVRDDAMQLLVDHAWPGNVRELINVVERAVLLCEGSEITPFDLPEEIRGGGRPSLVAAGEELVLEGGGDGADESLLAQPFRLARRAVVDAFERRYVEALLVRSHGRIQDAARLAELNTRSLYEKMQRLGIRKEAYKLQRD